MIFKSIYHSYFLYMSTWIANKVIRLQTEEGGRRKGSNPFPKEGCVAGHKLCLQNMPVEGVLPLPSETSYVQ